MEKKLFRFVVKNYCSVRELTNFYYCTVEKSASALIKEIKRMSKLAN